MQAKDTDYIQKLDSIQSANADELHKNNTQFRQTIAQLNQVAAENE